MALTDITVTPGTAQASALINSGENADSQLTAGNYRLAEVTVTFGGATHAAADVINLVRLPKGARVIADLIVIRTVDSFADTCTIDIGDDDDTTAADPDRYVDGADVAAAGVDLGSGKPGVAATTAPYTLQKPSWITMTLATLGSTPAAGILRVMIPYTIRN